jgi:predicted transcriptional regulator
MRIPFLPNNSNTSNQSKLMVALTPDGRKMAESWEGTGGSYEVLSTLAMAQRPLSIGMLAKESNLNYNECLAICRKLKAQGLVAPGSSQVGLPQ